MCVASYMYVQSSKSNDVVSYILCGLSPTKHQTLIDSSYATHPLRIATLLYYVAALKQNANWRVNGLWYNQAVWKHVSGCGYAAHNSLRASHVQAGSWSLRTSIDLYNSYLYEFIRVHKLPRFSGIQITWVHKLLELLW